MKLTQNFTSEEFKVSSSYPELASSIELTETDLVKMFYLATIFLQPVRSIFGPIKILSGKRSSELNSKIGGSANSDHLYSATTPKAAVDFTPLQAQARDVYEHIKDTRHGSYGQLIYYINSNFIHVSLPNETRLNETWEWNK